MSVLSSKLPAHEWDDSEWMGELTENPPLSALSIPGTHDSCAIIYDHSNEPVAFDVYLQKHTLGEQLQMGARYIDARCCLIDGVFTMHHGPYYLDINFGDVLNICNDFLSRHPSEVILIRVKQEYSEASDVDFIEVFNKKYKTDNMYLSSIIPNLDDVRGGVVIISNVAGLPGLQWNDLDVEDNYNVYANEKIELVKQAVGRAYYDNKTGRGIMHLTGLNIQTNFLQNPYSSSAEINGAIDTYLTILNSMGFNGKELALGVVAIDWYATTTNLQHRIINLNFNL